ncbi:uncharacterized protein LOC121759365 [Salvia splendens]|uniref:uncharacterized protein LOC121759365 n=1 Tax=Salvia splendens TaxID=180675 RepID=UPI001C267EBE|nr:uncharacterized protein LOC121759365 [Salvia splendens]
MSENGMKSEVILHHFLHQHPLILTVADATGYDRPRCDVCGCEIFSGDTIYKCSHDNCSSDHRITLHKECAERPREISLSSHPQHSLIQNKLPYTRDVETWDVPTLIPPSCAVCTHMIEGGKGYSCSSCNFYIHIGCAHSMDVMGEPSFTRHPSHPRHDLTLLRRPDALLRCDACGTIHRGNSYICTVCPYCINESCAALPAAFDCGHLHDHPLSLAYRLPLEYIKYRFRCDVCYKDLSPNNWVYHCGICRYVVHINCATSPLIQNTVDVDPDVVVCPIKDIAEEVIGPFVRKSGMAAISNVDEFVKCKNEFHNPDHQLRIISSSPCHQQKEKEDEDDDDLKYGFKSKLVCDGCTAPISSSSSEYISCGECEYFLHLACYVLPFGLSGHPLHPQPNHILTLQMCPTLNFIRCTICRFDTNGLVYCCKQCNFKVDIKCFCLPDTIRHAAHPRHNLNLQLMEVMTKGKRNIPRMCSACGVNTYGNFCYICDVCDIILHSWCALLPAQVSNRRWDKHPLPLTFDATANHPSEFFCELCEKEMNPKTWMYHCRGCDVSIHPACLPTALGWCRNIKFGQRYVIGAFHKHDIGYSASYPRRSRILSAWYQSITEFAQRYDGMTLHQYPVAYQLTNKLRCSICGVRKVYGTHGFQCDSHKCDFFVCFDLCARYLQNQTDFT